MRIAIVSDVHGNRTALAAVLADLRRTAPDLTLHGGDLADAGSSPAAVVDEIRDLGWPGVAGNTDEMLFDPPAFEDFAAAAPHLDAIWTATRALAAAARAALGEERLAWLRALPRQYVAGDTGLALVHATPASLWRAPTPEAGDEELAAAYGALGQPLVVYGHVHRPFVRHLAGRALTVANAGSAGLPHDGDPRAAYLLLDGTHATLRRVEYDHERERRELAAAGLPHADWIARMLATGRPQLP